MLKYSTYKSIHPTDEQPADQSVSPNVSQSTADQHKKQNRAAVSSSTAVERKRAQIVKDAEPKVEAWTYVSEPTASSKVNSSAVKKNKSKKTLRQKTLNLIQMTVQKSKWKSSGRLMICLLFAGVLLYGGFQHLVIAEESPAMKQSVIVSEGDSLWAIASQYKSPEADIRDYMASIREVNQLATSEIQSGDVLIIPSR